MSDQEHSLQHNEGAIFTCPKCGEIPREDVIFLCNSCKREELIYINDMYMCPACLNPGQNFECMVCNSKDVKMTLKAVPDNNS